MNSDEIIFSVVEHDHCSGIEMDVKPNADTGEIVIIESDKTELDQD